MRVAPTAVGRRLESEGYPAQRADPFIQALTFVRAYAEKKKISDKQALRDASPSYKTRNEKKPEETNPKPPTKQNKIQ